MINLQRRAKTIRNWSFAILVSVLVPTVALRADDCSLFADGQMYWVTGCANSCDTQHSACVTQFHCGSLMYFSCSDGSGGSQGFCGCYQAG
jgi:hypothetical protein